MKRYSVLAYGRPPEVNETKTGEWVAYEDVASAIKEEVEAEREACQKVALEKARQYNAEWTGHYIVEAIRARCQS